MLFADMIPSMKRQARFFRRTFEEAKKNHAALARFESVDAFLAELPLSLSMPADERHAIIIALLHENGAAKSPLWSCLLVIAFEPALRNLLKRVPSAPNDEREQVILTAFLEVLRSAARAEDCENAPAYIKRATELAVVRPLRHKADPVEFVEYNEDETLSDPNDVFSAPAYADIEVFAKLANCSSPEIVSALTKAAANRQSLKSVVIAMYPNASEAEQRTIWRKWLQARKATIAQAKS